MSAHDHQNRISTTIATQCNWKVNRQCWLMTMPIIPYHHHDLTMPYTMISLFIPYSASSSSSSERRQREKARHDGTGTDMAHSPNPIVRQFQFSSSIFQFVYISSYHEVIISARTSCTSHSVPPNQFFPLLLFFLSPSDDQYNEPMIDTKII